MPQIKKKGAVFAIFADSPSPPRLKAQQRTTSASANNDRQKLSTTSPTKQSASRTARNALGNPPAEPRNTARKALASKSIAQALKPVSTASDGSSKKSVLGAPVAKAGGKHDEDGRRTKGAFAVFKDDGHAKGLAPPKSSRPASARPSSSSWLRDGPPLRKPLRKPQDDSAATAPSSNVFSVFSDDNSASASSGSSAATPTMDSLSLSTPSPDRLPSQGSRVRSKPSVVTTIPPSDDKENRPPNSEDASETASDGLAAVLRASPSARPRRVNASAISLPPTIATPGGATAALDLEALGDAIMATSDATSSLQQMELGYGNGRKAAKVLQAAWSAASTDSHANRMQADDTEYLEETPREELDPALQPPFTVETPNKRSKSVHSRTASEDSPSKWNMATLASSTTTPLKRTTAASKEPATAHSLVGLGLGLPGLDMRFEPDAPLSDVSEAYGAARDTEPSGFRDVQPPHRQGAHAQQDSWSGSWGPDVSAYPTARRL